MCNPHRVRWPRSEVKTRRLEIDMVVDQSLLSLSPGIEGGKNADAFMHLR